MQVLIDVELGKTHEITHSTLGQKIMSAAERHNGCQECIWRTLRDSSPSIIIENIYVHKQKDEIFITTDDGSWIATHAAESYRAIARKTGMTDDEIAEDIKVQFPELSQ